IAQVNFCRFHPISRAPPPFGEFERARSLLETQIEVMDSFFLDNLAKDVGSITNSILEVRIAAASVHSSGMCGIPVRTRLSCKGARLGHGLYGRNCPWSKGD